MTDVIIQRSDLPREDRDAEGRIIRSKEWLEERRIRLEEKRAILLERLENIAAEDEVRAQELAEKELASKAPPEEVTVTE